MAFSPQKSMPSAKDPTAQMDCIENQFKTVKLQY